MGTGVRWGGFGGDVRSWGRALGGDGRSVGTGVRGGARDTRPGDRAGWRCGSGCVPGRRRRAARRAVHGRPARTAAAGGGVRRRLRRPRLHRWSGSSPTASRARWSTPTATVARRDRSSASSSTGTSTWCRASRSSSGRGGTGDRLYARGAQDMKVSALVQAQVFRELAARLPYPLALQLVADEEVGGRDGTLHQLEQGVTGGSSSSASTAAWTSWPTPRGCCTPGCGRAATAPTAPTRGSATTPCSSW